MKLGYSSKSLNNLLSDQPVNYQNQIKDWWGKKMAISLFWLMPSTFVLGLTLGFIIWGKP